MGAGLDFLMRKNVRVEQIVVFTDEGENRPPSFVDAYHAYVNQMNVKPSIVIVHIAGQWDSDVMSKNLTRAGIPFDMYRPENGDYYSLPGLVTLLSRKSNLDLVYEIMATPLVTGNGYRV